MLKIIVVSVCLSFVRRPLFSSFAQGFFTPMMLGYLQPHLFLCTDCCYIRSYKRQTFVNALLFHQQLFYHDIGE